MRVRVLFFGILKEIVGKPADEIDLPDGASVRDVLAHYGSQMPRLRESLPSLALPVNQQYAGPDTKLKPKEIVGKPADEIDLPDGASVRDVLAHYGSKPHRAD